MLRPHLIVFLAISFMQGFAQPYRSQRNPDEKSGEAPLVNQFEHLSIKDGLSNNSVNHILQDREGFMWFGTNEGLNKYDGHTFTVFRPDPAHPAHSFQSSRITALHEDRSTCLWVGTEGGGLHEVNKHTGRVTPHPIEARRSYQWNNQLSLYEDSRHVLWISTVAGLAGYEPARHQFTLYPSPRPTIPVKTCFEDRQHRFWVGTNQGLYLLNRATGQFTPVPIPVVNGPQPAIMSFYLDANDKLWLGTATAGFSLLRIDLHRQPWRPEPYNPGGRVNPFVFLNSVHCDAKGIIWLGTTNGLQAIDPVREQVFTYRSDPTVSAGISSNSAQVVYHDQSGMIWVGTDNGVDRQAVNIKPFAADQVTANKGNVNLPENRINALLKDSYGQLWCSNFSTLYRMSAGRNVFDVIPPGRIGSVGKHRNQVFGLLADGPAGIWLATSDGLYHFDQASGRYSAYPSDFVAQFVHRGPTGMLWIGGEGGIASFDPRTHRYTYYKHQKSTPNGLTDQYVNELLVSRTGDVWVLIKRLGICRLNPKTGRFTRYMAGLPGQLSSNDVLSIYEDRAGMLWIGTHLGGLNRFDPGTGRFSVITSRDGLPGNSVVGITSDPSGHLWLSTDNGLCRFDPRTRAIHCYEVTDGLPSNDFLTNAVFQQPDQLFFGSMNGVVHFDPSRIRDDTRPFPVYITALTVLDQPRAITDSVIRLPYDENSLSFGFAALAYGQPEQNQYAFQLVGVDKNWVQNGNRHLASYTNLSPGTYTFRVKAANSDGFWTRRPASVQLIIQPPWWATWWAYGFYALLAGCAIWGYIRFYTIRIRQRQELAFNRLQAEQLKSVDELKTRFFANITHEFRTPLSLIIAPVEKLLTENRFDRPTLTLVQRNAEQLLRLINQLLDLSKLEANYMAVALMQGEPTDFVGHIVEVFRRAAEQKGVTLTYNADDFHRQDLLFDADKWEKILTNLLSNALKFTEAGGHVTLILTPVAAVGEASGVGIEITDSGIGIAPEQLPHIFDRFYQADTSSTRAYGGTGIGLSLVNELVGLLGGSITVESQVNMGTTIRLLLPVRPVSASASAPKVSWSADRPAIDYLPVPAPALVGNRAAVVYPTSRILIVEDNDELRAFLVSELAASYQLLVAADGEEGWQLTQSELPDIVISDVMMPRMDGYELTRLIKNHPDTDHIAVVLLTAKAAQQSRIQGLQRGADDYLSKPFSVAELQLRLDNLITRQQKLGDYYRQQFALSPTAAPSEPIRDPFLDRIYELLENHLDEPDINVDWLADQLAMTRRTLLRKLRSLMQLTPTDLIRQYRLRRAADLLQAGYTVAETADRVGFKTSSHFSIVFKEFYRKTPTEFVGSSRRNV